MDLKHFNSTNYDDIIDLPHHRSDHHPALSRESRAAQFMPFRALTGFEDSTKETARLTDDRKELDETVTAEIGEVLTELRDRLLKKRSSEVFPEVRVLWFEHDKKKAGGAVRETHGRVRKVDDLEEQLVFTDGTRVHFEDLYEVTLKKSNE